MMYYTEKAKEIPVCGHADVLVVGAGPAGICAALAAARLGAKVILLEGQGDLGGVSTTGMMSHFTGHASSSLYEEILALSAQRNEGELFGVRTGVINPENLKTVYMEMLREAGVQYLLYTMVCAAITQGEKVLGVIAENKSGRGAYMAAVTVDASGDGDVAASAGVPFCKGREEDGKMQPVTLMFKVAGVNTENALFPGSFETDFPVEGGTVQGLARQNIPYPAGHVLLYKSTLPGVVTCNMTNCTGIDGTNAEDLTRGQTVCRSQMDAIVRYLRKFVPGYENCYIISAASLLGVRETRHLEGMYTLTKEDVESARYFENWAVKEAHFNFDVHNLSGPGLDDTGVQHAFKQPRPYSIPYACLVPKKTDGLLFAGRNISGTHMAHSNYRVMPICAALGQAAGTAAALAVKQGVQPREVAALEIQRYLP